MLSNTPGKIEFYSTIAERLGLNPLPTQYALKQEKNTSILLNSATPKYTHTQFQEVYSAIPPVIIIPRYHTDAVRVKWLALMALIQYAHRAPATPAKKEHTKNERSLYRKGLTPMTSAARSLSRMAMKARPIPERTIFFARKVVITARSMIR